MSSRSVSDIQTRAKLSYLKNDPSYEFIWRSNLENKHCQSRESKLKFTLL